MLFNSDPAQQLGILSQAFFVEVAKGERRRADEPVLVTAASAAELRRGLLAGASKAGSSLLLGGR
jgi:hypothetical protein